MDGETPPRQGGNAAPHRTDAREASDCLPMNDEVRSGRGRIVLARALTILALLIGFVSMLAFTLERTILDESGSSGSRPI